MRRLTPMATSSSSWSSVTAPLPVSTKVVRVGVGALVVLARVDAEVEAAAFATFAEHAVARERELRREPAALQAQRGRSSVLRWRSGSRRMMLMVPAMARVPVSAVARAELDALDHVGRDLLDREARRRALAVDEDLRVAAAHAAHAQVAAAAGPAVPA